MSSSDAEDKITFEDFDALIIIYPGIKTASKLAIFDIIVDKLEELFEMIPDFFIIPYDEVIDLIETNEYKNIVIAMDRSNDLNLDDLNLNNVIKFWYGYTYSPGYVPHTVKARYTENYSIMIKKKEVIIFTYIALDPVTGKIDRTDTYPRNYGIEITNPKAMMYNRTNGVYDVNWKAFFVESSHKQHKSYISPYNNMFLSDIPKTFDP